MYAAKITSACLPLIFPPITIVCAQVAAYPSICAPKSILTTSSVFNYIVSSGVGEKWPQISFTEIQHGNAIPLSNFFDFLLLKTFCNSSSMKLSIVPQIDETSAPSTQSAIAFSSASI